MTGCRITGRRSASRLGPEWIERQLAEIRSLHIGRHHHADRADVGGPDKFRRGVIRLRQRHRGDEAEPGGVRAAPRRQCVVERPMPGDPSLGREAVAVNVGPRRHELIIDVFLVEPRGALRDGLDQFGKERAHLEAIVEVQRRGGCILDQPHAELRAPVPCDGNQLGRHVMRVNVDDGPHRAMVTHAVHQALDFTK